VQVATITQVKQELFLLEFPEVDIRIFVTIDELRDLRKALTKSLKNAGYKPKA